MTKERRNYWDAPVHDKGEKGETSGGADPPDESEGNDLPELMAHQIERILYLQSSDHPGVQLVAAPLTGKNFL